MEVQFSSEAEKKLNELAEQSGRGTSEVLEDALAGYYEEIGELRRTLDKRYDDMRSGRVKGIPGEEVEAYFREKSAARRSRS